MGNDFFVHDKGICECADVGKGTRIWAFAHVMKGAALGTDCNIGEGCFVESGAVLGNNVTVKNNVSVWDCVVCEDDVFLGPACVLTNDVNPRSAVKIDRSEFLPTLIRQGATVGAGATIVCGVTLGRYAFVGAGAVVIRDVPDYGLVVGNPAKLIGYMDEKGERIDLETLTSPDGSVYEYLDAKALLEHSINPSGLRPKKP